MRHAVLVIGYGKKADVLQQTIRILDDKDIDFFIHWDARYNIPMLKAEFSNIFFMKDRISVKWGSDSLIKVTLRLLCLIKDKNYDYIHLISSSDIPLMTKDYFKNYFTKEVYIGFVSSEKEKELKKRISYWYPSNVDFRKHDFIFKFFLGVNKIFRINRLKKFSNISVNKGTEWFSIKKKYIKEILNYNTDVFLHGYCADEIIMPTIFSKFKKEQINISRDDCVQALRYIDWKRGTPYTFNIDDVNELKEKVNTRYAFARKVSDKNVPVKIFNFK